MGRFIEIGKAFETALFNGDKEGLRQVLHTDAVYEMSGQPPIGGRFEGRERVIESFWNRETGLGTGFEYQELGRHWFEDQSNAKVFVEIHERSWLPDYPDDVLEVRTCSVITFEGDHIVSLIDYTDSHAYAEFLNRHREHLPKFSRS